MRKFKRLNRKGFTLIELLAVIVILAVVMGVAATSVLSSMNNSRKSSLQNSAQSAADAFRTAYAEASLNNSGTVNGITITAKAAVALSTGGDTTLNALNITGSADGTKGNYNTGASYVFFDTDHDKIVVCLTASNTGSYYVANAISETDYTIPNSTQKLLTNTMWACSDNTNSWTNAKSS